MQETQLKRLIEGNNRFVQDQLQHQKQDNHRRVELLDGQHPFAVILSCADSRVVPELAFDCGLGELFVLRVAGNVANRSTIASIEYAVANLGTRLIVVLGHQSCGAVSAAVEGGDLGKNLNHLIGHINQALDASPDNASVNEVVKKNAMITADTLIAQSDIIRLAHESDGLKIAAAYYRLDNGEVEFLS